MITMSSLLLLLACTEKPLDSGSTGETGASGVETADSTPTEDSTQDSTQETAESADTAVDACEGVPTVTYQSFGRGFLVENCDGCHASTTTDRHDAPENVTFDSVDEVWTWSNVILSVATGDAPTMPPRGGVSDDDRTRLTWWLTCAEWGT